MTIQTFLLSVHRICGELDKRLDLTVLMNCHVATAGSIKWHCVASFVQLQEVIRHKTSDGSLSADSL